MVPFEKVVGIAHLGRVTIKTHHKPLGMVFMVILVKIVRELLEFWIKDRIED